MLTLLGVFLILATIIIVAGSWLAYFGDGIAETTGFGRLLVGSVLLAGATSLPELSVDLSAVQLNLPDLAVGDLLGSSLMNLLILAILDLTRHSRGKMLSRIAAGHALGGSFSIAMAALAGLALMTVSKFAHLSFLGAHLWLWLIGVAYFIGVRMVYLDQRLAVRAAEEQGTSHSANASRLTLGQSLLGFGVCALVILLIGPRMAATAGEIADKSGLGHTFVGTTLVALCTSLPELSASLAAVRLGAFDMAVGNVFGSNSFNMLLLLPLDIVYSGNLMLAANSVHLVSVFAAIAATSVVVMGQLYHAERRTFMVEPDAATVIGLILAALGLIYCAG